MDTPNWDLIQSAAAYSTLAGTLAGFALIALTVVVTVVGRHPDKAERPKLEMTIGWLFTAFISLMLVSFLFAVLAGHDRFVTTVDSTTHQLDYGAKTLQPVVLGLPTSMLFSSAATQLFLGVVWLFELVPLGRLAQLCARVMFWFMIPLSAVHVHAYFLTVQEEMTQSSPSLSLEAWMAAGVAALAPCVAFVLTRIVVWSRKRAASRRRNRVGTGPRISAPDRSQLDNPPPIPSAAIRYVAVIASLVITLAIGISFGFIESLTEASFSDPSFDLTSITWLVYGLLALLWTLFVLGLPTPLSTVQASPSNEDTVTQRKEVSSTANVQ